ncbi:hypothetical protein QR680_013777 [Steinernema hermaphroditum]|uniref:SXP/RAL-2 family protein Ani s 5-like cation-binding domain-containing protein n=1 Tax=Steinernema hermaphroditum TaxID=289476 RepID=A0AA39I987_9BILA|nr:hypothetical protein QR680_013777 [Steinernema hermaphroditum]
MKYLVAILALSALAYGQEAEANGVVEGTAVDAAGGAHHEHFKHPPIIEEAIKSFSAKGKEALKQIGKEAMEAFKKGQPIDKDQLMAKLKEASPEDAQKLDDAHKKLEDEVKTLSPAAQAVHDLAKKMHEAGKKPSAADIQAYAKGLKELPDGDRAKYFALFPSAKDFFDGPHFQDALEGKTEWGKKQ